MNRVTSPLYCNINETKKTRWLMCWMMNRARGWCNNGDPTCWQLGTRRSKSLGWRRERHGCGKSFLSHGFQSCRGSLRCEIGDAPWLWQFRRQNIMVSMLCVSYVHVTFSLVMNHMCASHITPGHEPHVCHSYYNKIYYFILLTSHFYVLNYQFYYTL